MSIVSSLAIVLLCFSFYSCNGRSFGMVDKVAAKVFEGSSDKKNEKLNPDRVSTQRNMKSSLQNAFEEAKQEGGSKENKAESDATNDPRKDDSKSKSNRVNASKNESREHVTWRVPHEKRGEPEVPGFNLDYLPPRTHPPAHN